MNTCLGGMVVRHRRRVGAAKGHFAFYADAVI